MHVHTQHRVCFLELLRELLVLLLIHYCLHWEKVNRVNYFALLEGVHLLERLDVLEKLVIEVVLEDVSLVDGHFAVDGGLQFGDKVEFKGTNGSFFIVYDYMEVERVEFV